jgi:acid ceramidase
MELTERIVDLELPVEKRWEFLEQFKMEINDLLDCYLNDFQEAAYLFKSIGDYKKEIISPNYLEEVKYIAAISKFDEDQVLIANLYYDVLKFYFGCTAFAVETGSTTYHCRNLDWHTNNNLLSRHSMVFNFKKNGETVFKTVGWPGFVGALSGTKPNKFSLTLNAVLSNDEPEIAFPVSFLLRDVLFKAESYQEAKEILESTPIASDCLILLSGIGRNEKVVIERTPKRFATRKSNDSFIVVTNDYKELENGKADTLLQATSCGRYDRAIELLRQKIPDTSEKCINILQDDKVMMRMTVQQMIFNNRTGEINLVKV